MLQENYTFDCSTSFSALKLLQLTLQQCIRKVRYNWNQNFFELWNVKLEINNFWLFYNHSKTQTLSFQPPELYQDSVPSLHLINCTKFLTSWALSTCKLMFTDLKSFVHLKLGENISKLRENISKLGENISELYCM